MPTPKTDYLISLINAMTKAEKRSFKLFVMRNQSKSNILFLRLFEEINRLGRYDEAEVLHNIPGIKKRQLSNLKAHLYKQILLSMRMLHRDLPDFSIRESIDNARLLYNKGLYRQSLEVLAKTKERAMQMYQYDLVLIILSEEKRIEAQHITHSMPNRVEELTEQSRWIADRLDRIGRLSGVALKLYRRYLQTGYVKNEEQARELTVFMAAAIDGEGLRQESGFYEELYLYQCYAWYYYMQQNFVNYYRYGKKWLSVFQEHPEMIAVERPVYLKCLHNILTALFMAQAYDRFVVAMERLESSLDEVSKPSWNEQGLYHLYLNLHRLNGRMMRGEFTPARSDVESLITLIKDNPYNWDEHRIMIFYYKIASIYFGARDYDRAIDYLNKIINQKTNSIRTDIQCFSRILSLIVHYELGNRKLIEYQVKSVYRFLSKMEELQGVQQAVFRFVRQIPKISTVEVKDKFALLRTELAEIADDPYENRAFLYLDIIGWLDAKLQNRSVEEVIRERYLNRHK